MNLEVECIEYLSELKDKLSLWLANHKYDQVLETYQHSTQLCKTCQAVDNLLEDILWGVSSEVDPELFAQHRKSSVPLSCHKQVMLFPEEVGTLPSLDLRIRPMLGVIPLMISCRKKITQLIETIDVILKNQVDSEYKVCMCQFYDIIHKALICSEINDAIEEVNVKGKVKSMIEKIRNQYMPYPNHTYILNKRRWRDVFGSLYYIDNNEVPFSSMEEAISDYDINHFISITDTKRFPLFKQIINDQIYIKVGGKFNADAVYFTTQGVPTYNLTLCKWVEDGSKDPIDIIN